MTVRHTHLRDDGALVNAYYFDTIDDAVQQHGGLRLIVTTIWRV